jgi:hypothetical protein
VLDLAVEVHEGDEASDRGLRSFVAAAAEADVVLEADRPRTGPVALDVSPAPVAGRGVDHDALDVRCGRVLGERPQRGGQAVGAVVVDEDDGELGHRARRARRQ